MRLPFALPAGLVGLVCLASCAVPIGRPVGPYLFETAEYRVVVGPDEQLCEVKAEMTVQTSQADQRIPILPRRVALRDWRADGAEVVAEEGGYVLWVREAGACRAAVTFVVPRSSPSPGMEQVRVPSVIATRSAFSVVLPTGTGEFTVSPQGIVTADETVGADRRIRLLAPAAEEVTLRWEKQPGAAEVEASFLARSDSSLQVGRGLVVRDARIACRVQRGALDVLRLQMPPGVVARQVAGPDVLRWELGDDGRTVSVTLARKVRDQVSVRVHAEQVVAAGAAEVSVSPITVIGAGLQEGALRLRPGLDLVLKETAVVGATRSGESYGGERPTLVYLYPRLPASVTVEVIEQQPRIAVRTESLAVIEAGVLTLETRLDYDVQTRAVRSVAIAVPEGATVLDVSGEIVRDWEVAEANRLVVRFQQALLGPGAIVVRLQQALRVMNGIPVDRLGPLQVHRDEGVIGVSAGEGVQLRHHAATLTEQIDPAALPEWIRTGGAKLAYRYSQPGGTLAVSTERIEPRLTAQVLDVIELAPDTILRRTTVDARIEQAEVFEVRLRIPRGLVPLRVTGEAVADWQLRPAAEDDKADLLVTLKKGQVGQVVFVLEASRMADYGEPLVIGSIDVPDARRVRGGVVIIPRADISLRPVSEIGLEPRPAGDVVRTVAVPAAAGPGLPADSVGYSYTGGWSLGLEVKRLEPQVATTAVTLLGLRHGQIAAETSFQCDIQNAAVSVLLVRLPEGAVNSWVEGPGISSRRLEGDTWQIVLGEKRRGVYRFRVTYDRLVAGGVQEVVHHEPEVLGAVSHKGWLVVAKEKADIDIAVSREGVLRAVDAAALPPWHGLRLDLPIMEIFEYSGRDWRLALTLRQLGEADILEVRATDCLLETLLGRDGSAVTFMTLTLENARRQFARIRLPEDRVLWGAYVDGKPVKPVRADEPQAYLIPLMGESRLVAGATRTRPFELTVVYTERYVTLEEYTADMAFTSPPVDVPTGSMTWAIYLPPEYRVMPEIGRRAGNMQLIWEPPESVEPGAGELFAEDLTRLERVWPVVRPYAVAVLWVIAGAVGLAVAAAAVYALARFGRWAVGRVAARTEGHPIRYVWRERRLRWAALIGVAVLLVGAGLLTVAALVPAVLSVAESREGLRSAQNLVELGQALRTYGEKYGKYPDSLETLANEGLISPELSATATVTGFDYRAGGRTTGELTVAAGNVIGYQELAGGYNVLNPDGTVQWLDKGDARVLAGKLYYQGDVDAPVVQEDLKFSEAEVDEYAKRYEMARRLQGRSRDNLDQLVGRDIQDRLAQRAGERYKDQAGPAVPGLKPEEAPGEARLDEQRERERKALAGQTVQILEEAQKKAGVEVTAARPAAEPPPAPPAPKPVEPSVPPPGVPEPVWKPWKLDETQAPAFGPVTAGRSRGALPIGLVLPEVDRSPYLFGSVFTGSGVGTFELTAARAGTSYTAYSIAGAAVVGLVLAAGGIMTARTRRRAGAARTERPAER